MTTRRGAHWPPLHAPLRTMRAEIWNFTHHFKNVECHIRRGSKDQQCKLILIAVGIVAPR